MVSVTVACWCCLDCYATARLRHPRMHQHMRICLSEAWLGDVLLSYPHRHEPSVQLFPYTTPIHLELLYAIGLSMPRDGGPNG